MHNGCARDLSRHAASVRLRTTTVAHLPISPAHVLAENPGLIALTVAEIKRVFGLVARPGSPSASSCVGLGGGAGIQGESAGSTNEPASESEPPIDNQVMKYGRPL